jgi:hypothetical protein
MGWIDWAEVTDGRGRIECVRVLCVIIFHKDEIRPTLIDDLRETLTTCTVLLAANNAAFAHSRPGLRCQ